MGPNVVVIGAGYAGVSATRRLIRGGADVTVINPRAEFVERIRLHQLVAGNHTAVVPLEQVVPQRARLEVAIASTIDAEARRIGLADSDTTIDYDYLVYAAGSFNTLDIIAGATTHAVTLGTLETARSARLRLENLADRSTITVVGGGLTGIETAAELAGSTTHSVRLITDRELAPSVSERGRRHIRAHLRNAGVEIAEDTAVQTVESGKLVMSDGSTAASDLTILASSVGVPDTARCSALQTDGRGALTIHDTLVSAGDPRIVGAGDAAAFARSPLRMSCQAAIPSGVHAAETVLALAAGKDPRELQRKFIGQCISLGRKDALFQSTNSHDEPRPRAMLTGRAAALVKEQICSSTMRFGHRGPFSCSWS